MTAAITSLGVGSGIDLQGTLDGLREIDEEVISKKEEDITELEAQLEEFTVVQSKLLDLKGFSLDLSMEGSFIERSVNVSNEEVLSVSIADGASLQTSTVTVENLASQSSWVSTGTASEDASVYVPTLQQTENGTTLAAADAGFINENGSLSIIFGSGESQQTINLDVTSGMSLDDVVRTINEDDENGGDGNPSLYVTAEVITEDGENFLSIQSTAGGSGEAERISVADTFVDINFQAPEKILSYQVGETTVSLSVAADTTFTELVVLINEDSENPGMTASVIDNGDEENPFQLILQADETGEENRITIVTGLDDLTLAEKQGVDGQSLNAQFTIDDIYYQRQSNVIDDVIPSVDFTLQGLGSSTISIANDTDNTQEMIVNLVNAYNDAITEIKDNSGYDFNEEEFGLLETSSFDDLPYGMQTLMNTIIAVDNESSVTSMFDLGIEYNSDGTITLDEEVLASMLAGNFDDVQDFFLGDPENEVEGFADKLNDYLRNVAMDESGIYATETAEAQRRIENMEDYIERETERLDKKYEILTRQFVELDTYMAQMTSLSDYLAQTFASISGDSG